MTLGLVPITIKPSTATSATALVVTARSRQFRAATIKSRYRSFHSSRAARYGLLPGPFSSTIACDSLIVCSISSCASTLRVECSESAPTQSPNPAVDVGVPVPRHCELQRSSRPTSGHPIYSSRPMPPLQQDSQRRVELPSPHPAMQPATHPKDWLHL